MPLVVRWTGRVKAGGVCDALVSFVDILPTLVDLAGGPAPPDIDGRSFKDVLLGRTTTFRDRIFASHTGDGDMNRFPQRCVRDARYKYILNPHPERTWTTHFTRVEGIPESHATVWNSWVARAATDTATRRLVAAIERHPAEGLYDTERDPWDLCNRAGDPALAPVLEAMRAELRRWMAAQGDPAAR